MIDINIDECVTSIEKITINSRNVNLNNNNTKSISSREYSVIKCYKNLPSITTLEAKSIDLIKIHKTIFFNLSNLLNIDLRDNKLLKISNNFKLFKELRSLKLDLNNISFIPSFIGELIHLEIFTISSNNLSYIPTSIQNLTSLKVFNFSNNKIDRLPIELGQLSSLQTLYMDGNYFQKIPTSICYLKRLSELSFDWLELVEPPYFKLIKDSVGKTIICIIIKFLEGMLKQSILFCDFETFIQKISPKKSESDENEKSLRETKHKNSLSNIEDFYEGGGKVDCPFSLNGGIFPNFKMNPPNLGNSKYSRIFHAIENKYYGAVKSYLDNEDGEMYLNIKNQENRTPFHVAINVKDDDIIDLFIEKIKQKNIQLSYLYLFKAIRTRNPKLVKELVNLGIRVDSTDDQGKGVFHILFSSFNKQISRCVLIGDFLLEKGAPVNNLDADNWAPIHIAANKGNKQCLLWIIASNKKLRAQGKEEFNLNLKGRNNWTPLHLTTGSFKMDETLLLLNQGCDIFARNIEAKTPKKVSLCNFVYSKLLSYYEIVRLREKYESLEDDKDEEDKKCIHRYNSLKNYKSNYDGGEEMEEQDLMLKRGETFNKFGISTKNVMENFKNKNKFKEKILSDNVFNIPNEQNIKNISEIYNDEPNSLIAQKERLLSCESSLNEKYESFMFIRISKSCNSDIIRSILDNIDLSNSGNINIISDICNYIVSNFMKTLIPTLKNLLKNKLLEKNEFIKKEIKNTIYILEKFTNNVVIPIHKQKTKVSSFAPGHF